MRLRDADETWFEQEIKPGEFFGQQALLDEAYRTVGARAERLREARCLAQNRRRRRSGSRSNARPSCERTCCDEGLAGRLRRIPLFRTLTDDQVRWLAQLVGERDLPAGAALDLANEPRHLDY